GGGWGAGWGMGEPGGLAAEGARGGARLCVFESPTNPTLRILDVAAVTKSCKAAGIQSLIDSTFAPPLLQRTLALGTDLVMHSATKFLNGPTDHLSAVTP